MQKEYKVIVEYYDSKKVYSINWLNQQDQLHREDGPAIECANGTKQWRLNGELHRTDGPAIEWAGGDKEWWLNGKQFSEQEFLQQTQSPPSCDGKVVEIDGKKYCLEEI